MLKFLIKCRWSVNAHYVNCFLFVSDRGSLLSDCGKLMVLDELLLQMKKENHRVLIYSQMTKMIDILEVLTTHFCKIDVQYNMVQYGNENA